MMTLAGGGGARGGKGQQNPKQQQQHGSGEGTQGQHYQRGGGHGYGGRGGKRGGQQNASAQQQQRTMERERQALQQRAPAPPHQQRQQQHPTPAPALPPESAPGFNGFNPADLSLAQALGQVLSSFSDTLATEHDIDARMRGHPQGANWRSCLEVMVEQSVRHGALHPECPDIRLSVHVVASSTTHGLVIMASHPAAAPFKFYLDANRHAGARADLMEAWLRLPAGAKRPYEEQAAAMRGLALGPAPGSAGEGFGAGGLPGSGRPPQQGGRGQDDALNGQEQMQRLELDMNSLSVAGQGEGGDALRGIGGLRSGGLSAGEPGGGSSEASPFARPSAPSGAGGGHFLQQGQQQSSGLLGEAPPGQGAPGQGGVGFGMPPMTAQQHHDMMMQHVYGLQQRLQQEAAQVEQAVKDGRLTQEQAQHHMNKGMQAFQMQVLQVQQQMQQRQMQQPPMQPHQQPQQQVPLTQQQKQRAEMEKFNAAERARVERLQQQHQQQQHLQQQLQQQQQQQQKSRPLPPPPLSHARQQPPPFIKARSDNTGAASAALQGMLSDDIVGRISDIVMKVYGDLMPQEDEMQARQNICNKLQRAIQMQWPSTKLVLFGSSGNNLCTKGSDLDLCLHVPLDVLNPNEGQYRNSRSSARERERQQKKRQKANLDSLLKKLAVLLRNGGMLDVEALTTARVPIVKFKVPDGLETTLDCDLCVNNVLACFNTELLYAYTMLDWRVRPLVHCIKHCVKRF